MPGTSSDLFKVPLAAEGRMNRSTSRGSQSRCPLARRNAYVTQSPPDRSISQAEGPAPATEGVPGVGKLDHETWRDCVRTMCGRYNPEGVVPRAFTGWLNSVEVCGFRSLNIGANAPRVERTYRDARLDGNDQFFVMYQLAGRAALKHNDERVRLDPGDVALVDAVLPACYWAGDDVQPWHVLSLNLPRATLVSHLGFQPKGGTVGRTGSLASRLLLDLIRNPDSRADASDPGSRYLQWTIYDLVGALVAPMSEQVGTRGTDRLFERIRRVTERRMEDPDFGPTELAGAAGISLRYLQKLFTARGLTCSEYIYSVRLDHAARLLRRRASLGTRQPLAEMAYACGFRDYSHFARRFHRRFGCPPGFHSASSNHKAVLTLTRGAE
jgi:AraC family transcriptional regulator, positive regulator of tynA and feaB